MSDYCHLHNHTQFSLLDGHSSIPSMISKAKADGQQAVAITDHGNMFGAFKFVAEANKQNVKPIVGCEFYLVEDRFQKSFVGGKKDKRYHQLLLAKNLEGYQNLSKLCSLGFIEGLYSKWPRVDFELIKQYKEGLIATSCCIGAIIPQTILHKGEEAAEAMLLEWVDVFGEDYYVELQRHGLDDIDNTGMSQEDVNQVLIRLANKHNIPIIATNDSHYTEEEDASAHDILLCVNTGESKYTPKGHGKGFRFGFPNNEFYFKSQEAMKQLFSDVPDAIENTMAIADKVKGIHLERDLPVLPKFSIPEGFESEAKYLEFLTFEGAKKRYGEPLESHVLERLEFELKTIIKAKYAGYFLIVQDFTTAARQLDVSVGPGRGSAAGSAIAYCLGITNVDPIKYDLLFERFLNPERVSMPDIDIDFDDEGRQRVIDYVVDKYTKDQVAQIITYGSMAAKSSLRDVGRVMDIPLQDVNQVAKSFPDHLSATLNKVLAKQGIDEKLKGKLNANQLQQAEEFRKTAAREDKIGEMVREAKNLEGSVRNTGVHACGIIITPEDIKNLIPVTTSKDSDLLLTQYDNSVVEDAGLLKMDFLGLRTLSIIKDAVALIKEGHDVDLDPDAFPLDDEKTFKLFQKGYTNGIFQFESGGMQKHLKDLKPDCFEDLIAMNALYRPGPMEYIPSYCARKHGREKVEFDHPLMEGRLKETYGITVYQEQVMLLAQDLAGFTKGQADELRKGMGKKKKEVIDKLWPTFEAGCKKNSIDEKTIKKVWQDWEAFASYAFNKSHSTCYALIAYQTAYLKAHYPAEYMASVLTHNMSDIKKVSFFMEECKRMKLSVLGPNINEAGAKFRVNTKGEIRFALSAIKGVGQLAVDELVKERLENGPYADIFDITARLRSNQVNNKTLESLAIAGAFDSFEGIRREQYIEKDPMDGLMLINKAVNYGQRLYQIQSSSQASLFGESEVETLVKPEAPATRQWSSIERLQKEKEVTGVYLSGHPLDPYRLDLNSFANSTTETMERRKSGVVRLGGIIASSDVRFSQKGQKYCRFVLEDFEGSMEFMLFREKFLEFEHFVQNPGHLLMITGAYKFNRYRDEYRFEIHAMELLDGLREKYTSRIDLHLKLDAVTTDLTDRIKILCEENKGDVPVYIKVYDTDNNVLNLTSNQYRIDPNRRFIEGLSAESSLTFQLGMAHRA